MAARQPLAVPVAPGRADRPRGAARAARAAPDARRPCVRANRRRSRFHCRADCGGVFLAMCA